MCRRSVPIDQLFVQDTQPGPAVSQVRFQVIAFGPLVPGFHPDQSLVRRPIGDVLDCGPDVPAELLGVGSLQYQAAAPGARCVVPVRENGRLINPTGGAQRKCNRLLGVPVDLGPAEELAAEPGPRSRVTGIMFTGSRMYTPASKPSRSIPVVCSDPDQQIADLGDQIKALQVRPTGHPLPPGRQTSDGWGDAPDGRQ